MTDIDISKNTALDSLACNGNQLTSLDVSKNTELNYLDCDEAVTVTGWPKEDRR
ncbi:MAG: hypothetical protein MR316_08030 [Lachnospiraceae bacterium]|nr:hypothetical protein [Lachnospiraceae bacterium]